MSTDSKSFVQGVFRTLYAEHPEHWGNGLSFRNFSPINGESVYAVRTKSANTPIGFVGWQNRIENGKTIGYYSVGLLPEYRGQGYAKEAVAKLIAEKSAGVDEVRALIHQSNTSSLRLAEALGVPVTKTAALHNNIMYTKSSTALLGPAFRFIGPRILAILKNKGVRAGIGTAAGLGVGEAENRLLYDPLARHLTGDETATASPLAHGGSRLLGALTGALGSQRGQLGKQLAAYVPKITALSGIEALNQGSKAYIHDAPMRQRIADTQLSTAQAAKDTAGIQQTMTNMMLQAAIEKAKNLSNTEKALYGVAGAGLLGAGTYAANSLFGGGKKKPAGKPPLATHRHPSKIRFDVPTEAMPPEFFQGLMKAEESGKGRAKYACFATRNELLQEIEQDLAFV